MVSSFLKAKEKLKRSYAEWLTLFLKTATVESCHTFYLPKFNYTDSKEKELSKDIPLPHGGGEAPCAASCKDLKKKYKEKLIESILVFVFSKTRHLEMN